MLRITNVKIPYKTTETQYPVYIAKKLRIASDEITSFKLIRKSLDARKSNQIVCVCTFDVCLKSENAILKKNKSDVKKHITKHYRFEYSNIITNDRPVIAGSGPAGLFCALMLARAGVRPIIAERGECVEQRKKTVSDFWNGGSLNVNSNVQFGEGGAGTFSDGKLTCGLNDIRMSFIAEEFAAHGAPDDIITNAKPHIGTDYLYDTVRNIRKEIISLGGEFRFNTLLTDIEIKGGCVTSVILKNLKTQKEEILPCRYLVCAIGHSARDTYEMMLQKGFRMERKPFSVGVRIEHKRELINRIQYKEAFKDTSLPAADYKLACHFENSSAYTFCMCPGGRVVASASEENRVVTNGMSNFARNEENSNSAILVSILPSDIEGDDILGGVRFQRMLEEAAFKAGGGNYFAPCQRVGDFLNGVKSKTHGEVIPSYMPGVTYCNLENVLPEFMCSTLKKALKEFDRKMHGFATHDAILTGVETRSSAPVRIVRDENCESNIRGVFPAGEGAGYAGGIMSSAIDGIKCAEKICEFINKTGTNA